MINLFHSLLAALRRTSPPPEWARFRGVGLVRDRAVPVMGSAWVIHAMKNGQIPDSERRA